MPLFTPGMDKGFAWSSDNENHLLVTPIAWEDLSAFTRAKDTPNL